MRIENTILNNLVTNIEFARKVFPFLKPEYFNEDRLESIIFQEQAKFFVKYNKLATPEILHIEVGNRTDISDEEIKGLNLRIKDFNFDSKVEQEWLINSTEKFCQEKALFLAIVNSVKIMEGKDKKLSKGAIPGLLQEALGVSFDSKLGHDYFPNAEEQYEWYHKVENKIPFDLALFNEITKGGLSKKTLNVILAGIHVGKTMFMCHVASSYVSQGKNVLYITLEMSQNEIAKRIDANLLDLTMDDLAIVDKVIYQKKIKKTEEKTHGKLIIKEYPTAAAHVNHFRAFIEELKLKKDFKPDVIIIDYLNICASARFKNRDNMYIYVKAVAEELRGLAVEYDLPILTGAQLNRTGFASSDPEMDDAGESFGLPATSDLLFSLITSEQLDQSNQILVKQLKNRYSDMSLMKRFVIGRDKPKMRFYDVSPSAQQNVAIDSNEGNAHNYQEKTKGFKFS